MFNFFYNRDSDDTLVTKLTQPCLVLRLTQGLLTFPVINFLSIEFLQNSLTRVYESHFFMRACEPCIEYEYAGVASRELPLACTTQDNHQKIYHSSNDRRLLLHSLLGRFQACLFWKISVNRLDFETYPRYLNFLEDSFATKV